MSDNDKSAGPAAPVPKAETAPSVAPVPAGSAVAAGGVASGAAGAAPEGGVVAEAPSAPTAAVEAAGLADAAAPGVVAGSGEAAAVAAGEAGTEADAMVAPAVTDSLDVVEGEGPTVDERLWATTLWMSAALMIFLPPIPVFLAPLIVKKLRKRPSEFVSWHAGNSLRFAAVATVFQVVYWVCAGLTALSLHRYWMLAFVPAVTLYTSFAVGMCTWLTLVGHNAWKGRRHRPSELRNLVFYK